MFNGNSFVELLPMENVDHKVSMEIDFKSHSLEGILVYAQQYPAISEGSDFISLALVDGHVEFRYDLGTGPALIRTSQRIRLGVWHRVQAKRWHRDGMLKLDDFDNVDGHSLGSLRSLDLGQPTYVGGVPHSADLSLGNVSRLITNLGMSKITGLDGCIKRFKIGHREVKIQSSSEPIALRRVSLNECQDHIGLNTPCSHKPCLNGGTCIVSAPVLEDRPYR
jgi:agrin